MHWPCLPDESRIETHTFPVPSHQPTCNGVLCHSPVLTDELSLLPPLVHWVPFTLTYPVTFPLKSHPLCQASLISSLLMGHCYHHNNHLLSSNPLTLLTLLAIISLWLLIVMNGCQYPLSYFFKWHDKNHHPTSVLSSSSGQGHSHTGEGIGLSVSPLTAPQDERLGECWKWDRCLWNSENYPQSMA